MPMTSRPRNTFKIKSKSHIYKKSWPPLLYIWAIPRAGLDNLDLPPGVIEGPNEMSPFRGCTHGVCCQNAIGGSCVCAAEPEAPEDEGCNEEGASHGDVRRRHLSLFQTVIALVTVPWALIYSAVSSANSRDLFPPLPSPISALYRERISTIRVGQISPATVGVLAVKISVWKMLNTSVVL